MVEIVATANGGSDMTEWMCMDPNYPERICDYGVCEIRCPYRETREKLEAVKRLMDQFRPDLPPDFKQGVSEALE